MFGATDQARKKSHSSRYIPNEELNVGFNLNIYNRKGGLHICIQEGMFSNI